MDTSTILNYSRESGDCNIIHRKPDERPTNIYHIKLSVNCKGRYIKTLDWQMYLCLHILNIVGRNAPITRNIRVKDIIIDNYRYTALMRKSDSQLFLINLTTNKIRHVKYQFEGLITEMNEERPKKKHKSST